MTTTTVKPVSVRDFGIGIEYTYAEESDARAARRALINAGRRVSLIAGKGDGYAFDLYDDDAAA
jgi:hypothetical protein